MKILINETQISNILKEILNTKKIDFYLDKINKIGWDNLTNKEKEELSRLSRGEDIESEVEDKPENYADERIGKKESNKLFDGDDEDVEDGPMMSSDELNRDKNELFLSFFTKTLKVMINGKGWIIDKVQDETRDYLEMACRTSNEKIYIDAFIDGDDIIIEYKDENEKTKKMIYHVENRIDNLADMANFLSLFFKEHLQRIIKKFENV